MATERLSMRQIREILRQKWVLGRPHREVAESLRIGLGTVSVVLERAKQAGLDWRTVQPLTEAAPEARLYTRPLVRVPESPARPWPDCAYIDRERRKPGVTLALRRRDVARARRVGRRATRGPAVPPGQRRRGGAPATAGHGVAPSRDSSSTPARANSSLTCGPS